MAPPNVPLDQVQGIILNGYGPLEYARFLLLHVRDATAARGWLQALIPAITNAVKQPDAEAVNLAFTFEGFKTMGLAQEAFDGFSREFREGMVTPHRQRVLGDLDRN